MLLTCEDEAGSAAGPAFTRGAGFRQQWIGSFPQTKAGKALAELREVDGQLGLRITLLFGILRLIIGADDRVGRRCIVQRFAGHPSSASTLSSVGLREAPFRFKDSAVNFTLPNERKLSRAE
jgi:hypothetical protein